MAVYPVVAIGQRLTANFLTSFLPQTIKKITSTSRASTITVAVDPELVLPVEANASYEFQFMMKYDASTAGDFKWTWGLPASATGSYTVGSLQETLASQNSDRLIWYASNSSGISAGLGVGTPVGIAGFGTLTIGATAGNLSFFWAQNTSDAGNTTVQADSYIKLTRIG